MNVTSRVYEWPLASCDQEHLNKQSWKQEMRKSWQFPGSIVAQQQHRGRRSQGLEVIREDGWDSPPNRVLSPQQDESLNLSFAIVLSRVWIELLLHNRPPRASWDVSIFSLLHFHNLAFVYFQIHDKAGEFGVPFIFSLIFWAEYFFRSKRLSCPPSRFCILWNGVYHIEKCEHHR